MRVPTFTFKNCGTGQEITINQCDYNDARYQYLTGLNVGGWERVRETSGDKGGYEISKKISDMAINIKDKRKTNPLKQKIIF